MYFQYISSHIHKNSIKLEITELKKKNPEISTEFPTGRYFIHLQSDSLNKNKSHLVYCMP